PDLSCLASLRKVLTESLSDPVRQLQMDEQTCVSGHVQDTMRVLDKVLARTILFFSSHYKKELRRSHLFVPRQVSHASSSSDRLPDFPAQLMCNNHMPRCS